MKKFEIAILIIAGVLVVSGVFYTVWIGYLSPSVGYTEYDWPMFGHDAQHTSYSMSPAPNESELAWHKEFILPSSLSTSGIPSVISNGILYLLDSYGNIDAINSSDGSNIWNASVNEITFFAPSVIDGKLIITTINGSVIALDPTNGNRIWNSTLSPIRNFPFISSSPTYSDGMLFVGAYNTTFALDIKTGAEIWNYSTEAVFWSTPAVSDGKVFIFSMDGTLSALNEMTGSLVWRSNGTGASQEFPYSLYAYPFTSPVISNDKVFIVTDKLYALNKDTGEKIWEFNTTHDFIPSAPPPAVANGYLYLANGYTICALTQNNGSLVWTHLLSGTMGYSPTIADGKLFITSTSGVSYLDVLNATTGESIWYYQLGLDTYYQPIVANGMVYLMSDNQDVYAFGTYFFTQ